MALINCPECGAEVSDKAAACIKCGNPVLTQEKKVVIVCPECGKEEPLENAEKCSNCGYPLNESTDPNRQKYIDQIIFDVANGISRKSTVRKLMKDGLTETEAIRLIDEVKSSAPEKKKIWKKSRNKFLAGLGVTLFGIVIASGQAESNNTSVFPGMMLIFGVGLILVGGYGMVKYRG